MSDRRSSALPGHFAATGAGPHRGAPGMTEPDPTLRPEPRPEDADRALRPQYARRFHRPGRGAGQPAGVHRKRAPARRGDGPRAVSRPAGPRQDHAGADHGARAGGEVPHDLRAGAGQGRRSRRDPDQSRAQRRAVHRRDPPAEPGGRGGALPGAGGFRARPGDRRGAGRAHRADRAAALHAGRRHHAARAADHAAARPVRHPDAAAILHRSTSCTRSSPATRVKLGAPADPDGAREIARRARGTPRIAGRLLRRVLDFAVVEGDGRHHPRDRRQRADPARGRPSRARRRRPALSDADRRALRAAARSGSRPCRRRCPRAATRWKR